MSIRFDSIFPVLANAIPGFEGSETDWAEPLPYMFMQEMLTFVCEKAASESYIETDLFSALLERFLCFVGEIGS